MRGVCRLRWLLTFALVASAGAVARQDLRAQATDLSSGEITGIQFLALGPFANDFGCGGDPNALLSPHIAPSSLHCQYPEEGDAVEYDPALASTDGIHPSAARDGSGNPVWYAWDDGTPFDGDQNMDGGPAGNIDDHNIYLLTYIEYEGEEPARIDICTRSDDDVQVWWDGRVLINEAECRGRGVPGDCQERFRELVVEPGVHRLILSVWDNLLAWGGGIRLLDSETGETIVEGTPGWAFLGRDRGGPAPACIPAPERRIETSEALESCPPSSLGPISVTIRQEGGDPAETVVVRERLLGLVAPSQVTAADGAVVAPILQDSGPPAGDRTVLAAHREILVHPVCAGGNGDTVEGPPGVFTLTNAGEDIWANGDTFEFAYNVVRGDFDVSARIVERTPALGSRWGKHGIMARQDLSSQSRYTFTHDSVGDVFSLPHNNDDSVRQAGRRTHGGTDMFEATPFPTNPSGDNVDDFCDGLGPDDGSCTVVHHDLLRLERVGSVFNSYSRASPDEEWTLLGSHDWGADAPDVVLVGLAATSHMIGCDNPVEIVFDEVDFGGADVRPIEELPPAGTEITWSVPRSELQGDGLAYEVAFGGGRLVFKGEAGGAEVLGTSRVDLVPPVEDLGPFDDPPFQHGHGIGPPCAGTGITAGGGEITIMGAGDDIWQTGDQFMFAYSPVSGDFSASVTIANQDFAPGSRWGKHGIMARQDCTPRARYSFLHDHGEDLQDATWMAHRPTHGGADNFECGDLARGGVIPAGVHFRRMRLDRRGSSFIGFVFDTDGILGRPGEWVEICRHDWGPSAPETVYLGLAVTSHAACEITTITFEDWVLIQGGAPRNVQCATVEAAVDVRWELDVSATSGDVAVALNGRMVASGLPPDTLSFTVPSSELEDGTNTITVSNAIGSGECGYLNGGDVYINAGGQRLDDALGSGIGDERVWLEDSLANPSVFLASGNRNVADYSRGFAPPIAVADTRLVEPRFVDSPARSRLFAAERWDEEEIRYRIPVAPGDYEVTLLFAEACCSEGCEDLNDPATSPGPCRVFDISINGELVADQFSQHVEAQRALGEALPNSRWGVALAMGPYLVRGADEIEVLIDDLGRGNPPHDVSIKGLAVERVVASGNRFVRGDADSDGGIGLTDGVFVLLSLFSGGDAPPCLDSADSDDDGRLSITDAIVILQWLFLGGPAPAPPSPQAAGYSREDCGTDTSKDPLDCNRTAGTCAG